MKTNFNYSQQQLSYLEKAEAKILKGLSELAFKMYMQKNKNIICL